MGQSSQKIIITQNIQSNQKSLTNLEQHQQPQNSTFQTSKIKVEFVSQKQKKSKKETQKKHQKQINNTKIKLINPNLNENDEMCVKIYENNKKYIEGRKNDKNPDILIRHKSSNNTIYDKKYMHKSLHGNPNEQILLKRVDDKKHDDGKLQYYKNNKKRIQESMDVCFCIEKALNSLSNNEILGFDEFKKLNAKNIEVLERKQKRIKNLEIRERKIKAVGNDDGQNISNNKSSVLLKMEKMQYFAQPKMLF